LQQAFPVTLLVSGTIPIFHSFKTQATFGGVRQLLGTEMSCDTCIGTIKKGAAQDFHYVHI
jgi:hypothetical protein